VAALAARRRALRQTIAAGPWRGVRDTIEPFDDSTDYLVDASNIYIPDPDGGSAAFGRGGFRLANEGAPVYTGTGQCVYTHIAVDGTIYPFIVGGGRLYRSSNPGVTHFDDVTPAGITIDPVSRVKMVSLGDVLIVSDGINQPWIATNLAGTPITGTKINYDSGAGTGVVWSAHDITAYGGALFAILHEVGSTDRHSDISWSEPGQPDIGWQQTDFDNNWTLEQTGQSPLTAIVGTNVALYYFRAQSIGAIAGAVGPDLQTTSTHDAISFNVGTVAWAGIQTFGNHIYFSDALGRPWRLPLGGTPEAIWLNMRHQVEQAPTQFTAITAQVTTSAFDPAQNLYLVAPYTQRAQTAAPPTQAFVFDTRSGRYIGRWNIKGPDGVAIEAMGTLLDGLGGSKLIILGSKDIAPAPGGWVWALDPISSAIKSFITTEASPPRNITTEGGNRLVTQSTDALWQDDGFLPDIMVQTTRLGYEADVMWNVDRCTVITGSPDPIEVAMQTTAIPQTLVGIPVPGLSADDTYRLVVGCSIAGRGTQVRVKPVNITTQWMINRISIVAVPSQARPEDA